jgi:predicted esterase
MTGRLSRSIPAAAATVAGLALVLAPAAGSPSALAATPSHTAPHAAHRVAMPSAHASAASTRRRDSVKGLPGMPTGVPKAATKHEPRLPHESGWPFPESFPRTEGAGRLSGGASLWTDYVYDDHGAFGVPTGTASNANVSSLAPAMGTYAYPSGPARNNGADIFRTAVGLTRHASYWRVDWNTLVDRSVPIAEWTFDTDDNASTGASSWPANAGLTSAGIERALVVSSHGAELLNASTGAVLHRFATRVDMRSRSFLVKIPRSVMPVTHSWRIRLAAGLADAAGTGFASVSPVDGAAPGEPNVYNVTFRSYKQEPELYCPSNIPLPTSGHTPTTECGNTWMENDQSSTLVTGNVSKFSRVVTWKSLAAKRHTAQPLPTGYTNRWYVSRLNLGQGVVANSGGGTGDLRPNYLGRIQPYAVVVPTGYNRKHPAPLTWVLHSLGANLNQYGVNAPTQLAEECQDRHSICATTEGYGPDGWYFDEAEVDFWQVWHALATSYALQPDTTVISGYSMGGFASYKLALAYPDLFAQAMPLEGPVVCGLRVEGQVQGSGGGPANGHCAKDGDTTPTLVNARWIPYVMTYGFVDELVPITGGLAQVQALDKLGYRYHAVEYPTEDHLVFAVQNDFTPATSQLKHLHRTRNPGHVTYVWHPRLTRPKLGIGPTGVYWVRGLSARKAAAGQLARIDARSAAIPDAKETPVRTTSLLTRFQPTPAVVKSLTWKRGKTPKARQHLRLATTDVKAYGVDTHRAGLRCGATVTAITDGPTALRLRRLPAGAAITEGGHRVAVAGRQGVAVVHLHKGTTKLRLCGAS